VSGAKWQFVKGKYPDGKVKIGVYGFDDDLVYDYNKWRKIMGINETDQSIIAKPTSTNGKLFTIYIGIG